MKARLKIVVLALLAATMMILMALPAAPQEPADDAPPSPTTEDTTGDQDTTAGDPTTAASATFDDFVRITNPSGSGDAEVRLDGSAGDGSTQWDIENDATAGNQLQFLHGFGTPQMVLTPGGDLGLGTTTPQDDLHIANTGNDHILLEDTDGSSWNIEAGGDFFDIDSTDFPLNNFRIHRAAPSNALVVTNGIGIGTTNPLDALDIRNIRGEPTVRFRITNGANSWANGVLPGGLFQFNKFGTGGSEFVVRERNHSTATLDVDGAVRASAFKTSSSKAFKTDTQDVDPLGVLTKLNSLPIDSWRFKGCAQGQGRVPNEDGAPASPCSGGPEGPRHIGPMAEDFHEVFGLGDGESIASVDADGVIMAAIQGLTQLVEEKDKRISELERRLDALEAQVSGGSPRGGPAR